jgi:hypothetical protein
MLRPMVSRSVCFGDKHSLAVHDQTFITIRSGGFVGMGRPLLREDESVVLTAPGPSHNNYFGVRVP